jgi:pimeloyl-ACP methyl ester carboxylesterase
MPVRPSQIRAEAQDTATMGSAVAAMQRRYRELRMPVVIMAGTQDRIVDHRKHSVWLHQEIAQSALRLVPGVGHMLHYAAPEQVVDAIEAFSNSTTLRSAADKIERPQSASLETVAPGP